MQKADITDRLNAYAEVTEMLGQYTESKCMYEAIEEIKKLRYALQRIGYDYVEFSHDKVQWLYLEHIKIAKEAYQNSFSESTPTPFEPVDDNF